MTGTTTICRETQTSELDHPAAMKTDLYVDLSCLVGFIISVLSRTKIHVKQVLIDYSINMNFIIMVLIIMINNFKWGCLAIGIFQIYQLDNTFLCLLHTNKLPDICTARSRLRKSPRRVLETNKHICSNKLTFVLMNILKKFKMPFIPILN